MPDQITNDSAGGPAESDVRTAVGSQPSSLPVLPLRDTVVLPQMVMPILVGRPRSRELVQHLIEDQLELVVLSGLKRDTDDPEPGDLYPTGTVARVVQLMALPDGNFRLVVEGETRVRVRGFSQTDPFFVADVDWLEDRPGDPIRTEALRRQVLSQFASLAQRSPYLDEQALRRARTTESPAALADFIAASLNLAAEPRQELLEAMDVEKRLDALTRILAGEISVLEVGAQIQEEVEADLAGTQREFILRKQLEAIRRELGELDGEAGDATADLRTRLEEAGLPEAVRKEAFRELERLVKVQEASPEHQVITTYLDWILRVPWSVASEDRLDVAEAEGILEEDHHALADIKERILEYLAVLQLTHDMRGPILALVGPPGVGKTSLGRSIARAMGREFVRISLGGVRDEAELRGHRRTYIGSMPGRIVQGLVRAGTRNPVIMLDEIDKLGADYRGDPSAALLEILDPRQNDTFTDHYLDVPVDLSQVMFIATANVLHTIPQPLIDRMEIIQVSGYTRDEKAEIARKYLIPRQLSEHGLDESDLQLGEGVIEGIVASYTREAGVRELERRIARVARKAAKRRVGGDSGVIDITADNLSEFLGSPKYRDKVVDTDDQVGVTAGLAVTGVGGDVLFVEASLIPGTGKVTITGQLGDVMRESAQAALTYTRAQTADLGSWFDERDIHIHVPEGAVPKDGPSAGVTMTTSLVSAVRGAAVDRSVAMTGEVTLHGKVLPIGGVKDKVLAAHRAGLRTVLLPADNEKDLDDVPASVRDELDIRLVSNMEEVLEVALVG